MKNISLLGFCIIAVIAMGFTGKTEIAPCYITFDKGEGLKMTPPDRFPKESDHTRPLPLMIGETSITIKDGYRILYLNDKNTPFVNLKVELSEPGSYEKDKKNLLANLNFINSATAGTESKELIKLRYNGYDIYGLSRNSTDVGSTLGIFIMFPGNDVVVYFYFNNLKPGYSNYKSLEDYKTQRNNFIGAYTKHIANCKK